MTWRELVRVSLILNVMHTELCRLWNTVKGKSSQDLFEIKKVFFPLPQILLRRSKEILERLAC